MPFLLPPGEGASKGRMRVRAKPHIARHCEASPVPSPQPPPPKGEGLERRWESLMAWLSLLLFLPWFCVMSALYWWFPRQPRHRLRTLFDGAALALALLLSIVGMHWGYATGAAEADVDSMWKQILAVLYAYG